MAPMVAPAAPSLVVALMEPWSCGERVRVPFQNHLRQLKGNSASPSQITSGVSISDMALDGSSTRDGHHTVCQNIVQNDAIERIARLNVPTIHRLVDPHSNRGSRRKND
jgi:hypothetical protein